MEYISGPTNQAADFLSRLEPEDLQVSAVTRAKAAQNKPLIEENESDDDIEPDDEPPEAQPDFNQLTDPENMAAEQKRDPFIQKILLQLEEGNVNKGELCRFMICEDTLLRIWRIRGMAESVLQTVIPKSLVPYILHQNHGANSAAHFGVGKVTKKVLGRFW